MQVLVFADTHGRSRRMLNIVEENISSTHAVFFLGDGARDADELERKFPKLLLYRVHGNCDFGDFFPNSALVPLGGFLFFYTHGHSYQVKDELDSLWNAANARGADVALFAHTHIPHNEQRRGLHLFNPGSLGLPRAGSYSWGRISIEKGAAPVFEIFST